MDAFPLLPYDEWTPTRIGLHLRCQIIGKIRLALMPKRNHWWHVPLYVSTRGLTTRPMPVGDGRLVEIEIDVLHHFVQIHCTDGRHRRVPVEDGQSIKVFYEALMRALADLDVNASIHAVPFDAPSTTPFAEDTEHAAYDASYVQRFWHILTQIQPVFQAFQGRYLGKDTPVHLFWHSFDLAYTRFSGREGPEMPDADPVTREAYSHEVISFGFWAGDASTPEPGFYSYTYPEPPGIVDTELEPEGAVWNTGDSGALAFYPYAAMRQAGDPEAALLAFLQSAFAAGASAPGSGFDR